MERASEREALLRELYAALDRLEVFAAAQNAHEYTELIDLSLQFRGRATQVLGCGEKDASSPPKRGSDAGSV
jgi:hypothetical protein